VGLLSLTRSDEPHCPKCKDKPVSGQHKLTRGDLEKLTGRAARVVRATGGLTCQCGFCSALYVYRDGFSTFLCYR
jgi:ribosomal protein L34E